MPGTCNFQVVSGDTFRTVITWEAGGALVDLTGYSALFEVLDWSGEPVITATSETDMGIVIGGPLGTIEITAQTTGVPGGCYQYRLVMTSGEIVTTLLVGSFEVSAIAAPVPA